MEEALKMNLSILVQIIAAEAFRCPRAGSDIRQRAAALRDCLCRAVTRSAALVSPTRLPEILGASGRWGGRCRALSRTVHRSSLDTGRFPLNSSVRTVSLGGTGILNHFKASCRQTRSGDLFPAFFKNQIMSLYDNLLNVRPFAVWGCCSLNQWTENVEAHFS